MTRKLETLLILALICTITGVVLVFLPIFKTNTLEDTLFGTGLGLWMAFFIMIPGREKVG